MELSNITHSIEIIVRCVCLFYCIYSRSEKEEVDNVSPGKEPETKELEAPEDDKPKGLSRSQQKKRRKYESIQQHWKEKKRLKKIQKKEKAKDQVKQPVQSLESSSQYLLDDLSVEERARLKEEHRKQKEQWLEDMKTSPRVVIDLDFQELMRPNELSSLIQQVMYSYGCIRRGEKPLRLVLTSVKDEAKVKLEKIKGFESWLVGVELVLKRRWSDLRSQ